MIVNIDIIGTVGEGKTSICFMLKEFFEDLTENFEIEIKDDEIVREFDWKQWEKYRERFKNSFKDKDLKVNIKTIAVKRELNEN